MGPVVPVDQWVYVTSSNVFAWRWSESAEELTIWFHSNKRYTYPGVSQAMVASLMAAPSTGKWVNAHLVKTGWAFR